MFYVHYHDVIISAMASQITGVSIVYSTVCSCADQRGYQSSTSLAFVRGIHRWPVNSPHKWPVTRKMILFDDVIMCNGTGTYVDFLDITLINVTFGCHWRHWTTINGYYRMVDKTSTHMFLNANIYHDIIWTMYKFWYLFQFVQSLASIWIIMGSR